MKKTLLIGSTVTLFGTIIAGILCLKNMTEVVDHYMIMHAKEL